jgi:mycofactocin biosynthesis protein MftB
VLELGRGYEIDPLVAMRPEPFGALAYHYGNRRLVFIRAPLVPVVEALAEAPSLDDAFERAGVPRARWDGHLHALGSLERAGIVRRRPAAVEQ